MSGIFDGLGGMTDDPLGATTGMPHLLQHLWNAYRAWVGDQLLARQQAGQPAADIETALRRAPATSFVKFATDYLAEHRIHEVFQLDANCGVRLTNNVLVSIAPPTETDSGATVPWRSVSITPDLTRHTSNRVDLGPDMGG